MSVQLYNRFLALLVLMALAAAVALAFRPVRRAAGGFGLDRSWRWPAFVLAAAATAGSLVFSEVIGYEPCELCWYQRITMYPMVVIFGVDLLGGESRTRRYALASGSGGVGYQCLSLSGAGSLGCRRRSVQDRGVVLCPICGGVRVRLDPVHGRGGIRPDHHYPPGFRTTGL